MMIEGQIIHKLKQDIEEKERSYQKELQKIKEEKELLAYIKGMLDITAANVSNFPYYDPNDLETKDAEEDFNVMLKYFFSTRERAGELRTWYMEQTPQKEPMISYLSWHEYLFKL